MCRYLKHQGNWKLKQFKGMDFNTIREKFESLFRIQSHFVQPDERTKQLAGFELFPRPQKKLITAVSTGAVTSIETQAIYSTEGELNLRSRKRKRLEEAPKEVGDTLSDSESRQCIKFLRDEDTLKNQIPIGGHSPIIKLGIVTTELGETNEVLRQDGSLYYCRSLREVLEVFNRQDVFALYKCSQTELLPMMARGYEVMLWGDMELMMEANEASSFWKTQDTWRIYN